MDFEWDENKNVSNNDKHGVSFPEAARMLMSGQVYEVLSTHEDEKRTVKSKEKIVRYTSEEIEKMPGQTDWEKVDSITDEELGEMVKNDPDDVYLTDEDFAAGKWVKRYAESKKQEQATIYLDEDVLDFFRKKGEGYQRRINYALRAFMTAQQEK